MQNSSFCHNCTWNCANFLKFDKWFLISLPQVKNSFEKAITDEKIHAVIFLLKKTILQVSL